MKFIFFLLIATASFAEAADIPAGKILFQPMFIWVDTEVTHQGTGYLITEDKHIYAITSLHFLNFDGPGLFEAIWLDVPTNTTKFGFRKCLGKPKIRGLKTYSEIEHDFLVLPLTRKLIENYSILEIDTRSKIRVGEELMFPNKDFNKKIGHTWIPAIVVSDNGKSIDIELKKNIKLLSQSGSPVISKVTGKVIGMLSTGGQDNGRIILTLCPARNITKHIRRNKNVHPLQFTIK